MFKIITAALVATASGSMASWDTKCGSKFDRIETQKLTMTTANGKYEPMVGLNLFLDPNTAAIDTH